MLKHNNDDLNKKQLKIIKILANKNFISRFYSQMYTLKHIKNEITYYKYIVTHFPMFNL